MINYVLMFLAGILTKTTDALSEHGLRLFPHAETITGLAYGIILGIVMTSTSMNVASMMYAVIIGVIIAGKINSQGHYLGIAALLTILFLLGTPSPNPVLFIILLGWCVVEELINDQLGHLKLNQKVKKLIEIRPLLEIATLIAAVILNEWNIWLYLLAYDTGYVLINQLVKSV